MIEGIAPEVITPPALRAEAFDEQQLKREWDAACEDEQDAVERKHAILMKALARWPMVLSDHPGLRAQGRMVYHPEMRRFVRDVLGMPDNHDGGLNSDAGKLIRYGVSGARKRVNAAINKIRRRRAALEQLVVGLETKFNMGEINSDLYRRAIHDLMEEYRNA